MNGYRWHGGSHSVLECVENARDLGGYPLEDGGLTKSGRVIRCEVPEFPTEKDLEFLRNHGFVHAVDLRERSIKEAHPHGLKGRDGFVYHDCPVTAGAKVADAPEEVPLIYLSVTEEENFRHAWKIFAQAEGGILYNCTAGRDRTGTFSMILLTHTGVLHDAVVEDYVVTKEYNRRRFERIRAERPHIKIDVICPRAEYAEEFLRLFRETYGSTDGYFRRIGLTDDEIAKIRTKLR